MKYPEEMYVDSQLFMADMDGSESNFTEKNCENQKITQMLCMWKRNSAY